MLYSLLGYNMSGISEELSNLTAVFLASSPYENTVENNWLNLKMLCYNIKDY